MTRSAKSRQAALDRLERPYPARELKEFLQVAQEALGNISSSCSGSLMLVARTLLSVHNEIPAGYGAACVRHFHRRNEQLEPILKLSAERRLSLIGLAARASLHWSPMPVSREVSQHSYKTYIRTVIEVRPLPAESMRWCDVIMFLLQSKDSTHVIFRNVAYALVWCGYFFSPDTSPVTDQYLARVFFNADRAEFVRFRQEGLRLLVLLLEFSMFTQDTSLLRSSIAPAASQPPAGGNL